MNLQFWEVGALLRHLQGYLVNARRFFMGWSVAEIPRTEDSRREES